MNKKDVNLRSIYYKRFLKAFVKQDSVKICFYGIRYVNTFKFNISTDEKLRLCREIKEIDKDVKAYAAHLTFKEFVSVFPINKDFNDDSIMKNYWTTLEYLFDKNMDNKIGKDNVESLFKNYCNDDVLDYMFRMYIVDTYLK